MNDWTVYARNATAGREGQPDFETFEALCRFNDVGEWKLTGVPFDLARTLTLLDPQTGIDLDYKGDSVIAGNWTRKERKRASGVNRVDLIGGDDMVELGHRLVHPQPASTAPSGTPPVYGTQTHDVRTGQASALMYQYADVNAGPGAISPRQLPGLTLGIDPGLGPSITARGRWQPLSDLLAAIAATSESTAGVRIGWRLRRRVFEVYRPVDRSADIVFSLDTDTLTEFTGTTDAPEADYVFVGGSGEGIARVIAEVQDATISARWGRREMFRNQTGTSDVTELQQTGNVELADRGERTTIKMTPVDALGHRFKDDYDLGDLVTVVADGDRYVQPVAAVKVTIAGDGVTATPMVGPATVGLPLQPLQLQRTLDSMNQRLTGLEVQ